MTLYDPDEPSGSGFWHWAVADIPASVTGLPTGAGDGTRQRLPTRAFHLPNDARLARFIGAAPPPGDGRHRYVIVVQAIGIEKVGQLQVQADSTPAWLGHSINTGGHLLGRAVIAPWAEIPRLTPRLECDDLIVIVDADPKERHFRRSLLVGLGDRELAAEGDGEGDSPLCGRFTIVSRASR